MNITDIKIRKIYPNNSGKLRALVSVTLDKEIAIHDIKVIENSGRLFAAMPSKKEEDGTFRDIAHPITSEARQFLEEAILKKYTACLEEVQKSEETPQEET